MSVVNKDKVFVEMITWKDITGSFGDTTLDFPFITYTTIGIVAKETEEYVILISQFGEDDNDKNILIKIPKCVILERVKFVRKK